MKKIKLFTVALFAGFFLQQLALAQTNTIASVTESAAPMTGGVSNETAISVFTTNAAAGSFTGSNAPAMAEGGSLSASNETAGTNAPVAATVPIQFQDIPITTAIESLARLAGINYLLDPKIGYGQPDQNGQIKPEPTLSVRWENVTAEQALVSLLDNYGLQLVENPKTKIARITTKDPSAPPPLITRVFQLKYSSTSNMNFAVGSSLTDKRSRVVPDTRTSQLVVIATEPEQEAVDTLLNLLDKPTRQVLIETHLVELSSNPSTEKGVDWSGTLQAQNVTFGNGSTFLSPPTAGTPATTTVGSGGATVTTPAQPGSPGLLSGILGNPGILANTANGFNPATFFLNADGAHAVLSFLNASSDAQVISTPRVVTLDNEAATIQVVRAFPVFNTTAGTQGSPGGSQLTYSNLGTTLVVTPRISANDYIWLKVVPSVSSFFGKETETINGLVNTADIFDTRTIDTQVLIPNAHTLVMGGLVKDNPNTSYTKVPFLGDIPILGLAFRHEAKSMEKDNLLIFICPTIVTDSDFKSTVTSFLDTKPKTMKDAMNPHTMWDGGAPHGNWSNPLPEGDYDKVSGEAQTSQMPAPSK